MNLRKPMLSASTTAPPATGAPAAAPVANPGRTVAARNAAGPTPTKSPKGSRGAKANGAPAPLERRYHQTIRRIDLWSVLKVSICFYLCALLVFLVAGIILWFVADTFNVIHDVESFVGDLFEDKGFHFFPAEILRAATLLGLVFVSLATVMTVLATGFYNLFSDLIGGIEITVAEES